MSILLLLLAILIVIVISYLIYLLNKKINTVEKSIKDDIKEKINSIVDTLEEVKDGGAYVVEQLSDFENNLQSYVTTSDLDNFSEKVYNEIINALNSVSIRKTQKRS